MSIILIEGNEIQAPNNNYPQRKFKLIKNIQNIDNNIYISEVSGWNELKEVTLQILESYRVDQRFIENLNFIKQSQEKSETKEIFSSNIIKILDSNWINQQYFLIVMEKIETDLYQYLQQSTIKLEQREKLQICFDITQSIALIHNHDYLNRDIKPESFFKVQNRFKLANFQLMRKQIHQDSMMMTQNIGTKMFSAPEMIQNKPKYTQKVDIWSLACVFYEIFDGKPSFDYPEIEIVNHIKNQNPVLEKIDCLHAPNEIKQLMKYMLNPEEDKRLNCQQIIQSLEQIIKSLEKIRGCQMPNTLQPIPQTPQKEINKKTQNNKQKKLQTSQTEDQRIKSLEQKVIEFSETIKQLNENQQNDQQNLRKQEQNIKDLQSKCNQQKKSVEVEYQQDFSLIKYEIESNYIIQIKKKIAHLLNNQQFNHINEDRKQIDVIDIFFQSNNLENPLQNQKQQQSFQQQYQLYELQKQTYLNNLKPIKKQNQFQSIDKQQNDQKQEKKDEYANNNRKKVKL